MVKGKQGLYLEAWKFGIYISIPIFASAYYSDPEAQKYWADYWQFIKYPENPNTNVKEKIRALAKEKADLAQQRQAYRDQLRELQVAADRSKSYGDGAIVVAGDVAANKPSWWSRLGGWVMGRSRSATADVNAEQGAESAK
eukprot:CAMPEP_0198115812 /NCGR_PEP_ID=MMETSP1442-20131203/7303_1 /TAXON_ID= /ORGANISM="Craspedostauros australis, Strain CCMP3328" /LENGTH=140 /DNA_ID=CAMNT_0043773389 /DNA_START=139 /DNA_END=561 /DNA_ORIENTATION=-